jgi:methylglutaconyl-CoA hydratase
MNNPLTTLTHHIENRIATITLNRPDKRNALNAELINELSGALTEAEKNPDVKAIVLKANGNTFCSGADLDQLKAMQSNSYYENMGDSQRLKNLFKKIYTLKKIVIAQVEGYALAGGCGLATVCDFTFCTHESKFGYTEARIGFVPAIVMVFLLRKIGEKKAGQLLLGAEIVSAHDALQIGLVNAIFEKSEIEKSVSAFVQKLITQNSAQSMAITKTMLYEMQATSLDKALEYACHQNALARSTEDCKKGVQAFLEKKEVKW